MSREIVLKQNDIAAMADLSRDAVNTILQQFSSKGLVERRYGSVVVAKIKP